MNSITKPTDHFLNLSNLDHFFQSWNELLNRSPFQHIPAVNVVKTKEGYEMDFAAPGLEKGDFKIDLEGDQLTVSAEKKSESKQEDKTYSKREYNYSSFSRTFTLPDNVIKDQISAKYDNGVLKLTIPRKELEAPKKAVKIGVN
ncbi:Hsp20/alpha crystallin family protein [Leptospira sp. WS58.C1]|jgi:HSP20 family protein|uniref:Hsp20/alpha crystallin family protein n=1 Tax=Leptospira TaxID=171 RepID=UPI0002BF829B|nr:MULTISPECIES: Hsp20/alpha crystallin family protein [unclassified Leptospira]EMK01656.1 spore protein SP21 family protein [Leptospira sp. B5-022]MCR1793339.1 Hsp20/alpha crystallin family protein [Leptospira sp. id769339]